MEDLLRVGALLMLVAGNAFFVVGEYAVVTARRAALRQRAEEGDARARATIRLMDDPVRVISTVQVGITAIGILSGAIGEPLVRELLGEGVPDWLGFVLAFAIVTYLSVVFGELVPKALTLDRAESLAVLVARPILAVSVLLRPAVAVLEGSARVLLKPFGIHEVVVGDSIRSPEELREAIDEAEGAGVIPRAQEEMLHNIFEFAGEEARDVMVPAAEVAWLDGRMTAAEAVDAAMAHPHSRYPIGDGSLDRLQGILHVHELVAAARTDPDAPIGALARPAPAIPGTKDLAALLRELRENRQQLAFVVDEYGGTAGIVALEDILEEIVGEIEDEYDLPDDTLTWVDDTTVLVAGSMTVDDFNEMLGTSLPRDTARTMAGLVFDALGRRPVCGDEVNLDGIRVAVEEVDALRITRLRVAPLTRPGDEHGT